MSTPLHGRPKYRPDDAYFNTLGNIHVQRNVYDIASTAFKHFNQLATILNSRRGCIFESAYDYPGRYSRWTIGFFNPPIALESWGLRFTLSALNSRGEVLLKAFEKSFRSCDSIDQNSIKIDKCAISASVLPQPADVRFPEEQRSKQNSVFSVIRNIMSLWSTKEDPQLGLYGSFGYDLTLQFESVRLKHVRDPNQRDLLLYLPDSILVLDGMLNQAWKLEYDFEVVVEEEKGSTISTIGLPRDGAEVPFVGETIPHRRRDHEPGEFAASVETAREEFKVGNLFEAVLSQTFYEPCISTPSELFRILRLRNPSPYMFLMNLGRQEWLVGASPEMFVRVENTDSGMRVESCPISGTIKRGSDALEDATRIREILVNSKEESELTMCTDVDRNDKSRICVEGSVKVLGRRQIEKYSALIHTVDHVEGYLREGFDALDAFLTHTWAVTVTGAPKLWAIQFVESTEKSPRCWYAGAVGMICFDGSLNTGMTLRTIRLKDGVAEIRAGATLLFDSVPDKEEKETELKAFAFRDAVLSANGPSDLEMNTSLQLPPKNMDIVRNCQKRVVIIDHQDSFVHTLANYVRQVGVEVITVRYGVTKEYLTELNPSWVFLSPGPGNPSTFNCSGTLSMLCSMRIPVFGVCLGLQSIAEHFGAKLGVLGYPMHGKPSNVKLTRSESKWRMFEGLPSEFCVARYHSLYAARSSVDAAEDLLVTAELADGMVMGLEHAKLPLAAVQFHPESILTKSANGIQIISNVLKYLHYET